MKRILVILTAVLFAQFSLSSAQQMKIITAGEAEFIPEFNGVVVLDKDKFILNLNIPANMRDKEYQNVDLQNGDEIQFVNGKKIKTIKDFKMMYTETKTGNEVKFGIIRNGQRFIVSFKKASAPKGERKIIQNGGGNQQNIKMVNGKVFINGKEANPDSLKKAGMNIMIKKGKDD
jgi:hypothetical protein